jgi:DNA-binding FadR family transcriptional regulator
MTRFKPIKQSRVSDEVIDQLKESILVGHFKAGDKLPSEREMAEEFQVSRVAIREALRALENSGFITTRQGVTGGAYITDLTFGHLARAFLDLFLANKISIPELYQVRLLIEPEVARLAALRITPEYADKLRILLEAEELPPLSLTEDIDRKTAVHYMLAEMCGNRFFEAMIRSAMGVTTKIIEAVQPDPYAMHPAGLHRPIVEAVIAGDGDAAASLMKKHSIEFGETLINMEKIYREKKPQKQF